MNKLKEIRTKKVVMSQWKLAQLSRVHQSKISLCENGLIDLRPDEQDSIAKILNTPVSEIFPRIMKSM